MNFRLPAHAPEIYKLCREGAYQMALVDDGMPCAICGEPIDSVSSGNIFATTYFSIEHPDFRVLDDSAAHRECMAQWELRDAFVAYYNTHCRNELRVDRNGDVRYRTSLLELITQTPIVYIAKPILLAIVGWSNIFGMSRVAVIVGAVFPPTFVFLIALLTWLHFGTTWAAIAFTIMWAIFAWSGARMLASGRARLKHNK